VTPLDSRVHSRIINGILRRGRAPRVDELARELAIGGDEARASLHRLHDDHALVLHPGSDDDIWVIHPFALWPTPYWVTSASGQSWWGNCAWCSLGIAALAGEDVAVRTTLGGESEPVVFHVRDGVVEPGDLLAHFTRPVARAWDNVIYYCGTVLVFRSEAEIDRWCERHGIARGEAVPLAQVWELAKLWYGQHASPEWKKWTPAEAQSIFARAGLGGAFWHVPQHGERF
jgi:Alkylmercury lyase